MNLANKLAFELVVKIEFSERNIVATRVDYITLFTHVQKS